MQYYNSGSMLGCDGKVYSQGTVDFLTALACIQLEGGLSPVPGRPGPARLHPGRGRRGYVSPTVVNNALDCLTKGTGCGTFAVQDLPRPAGRDDLVHELGRDVRERVVERGGPPRGRHAVT